jgi:Lon protease-like protein
MTQQSGAPQLPAAIPIFPLPGVVLFPRAVLPLHIFEERYKKMTADALRTHRQVAMALLTPGWEKHYYGRPTIEPVVCVGTIVSHERLPDGRYNFLLQGQTRARVIEEVGEEPYRQARVERLPEVGASEDDLRDARRRLVELFARDSYTSLPAGRQIRELLGTSIPTPAIADLLAFNVLSEGQTALKQELLAEGDVRRRVERIVEAVAALRPVWQNIPHDVGLN